MAKFRSRVASGVLVWLAPAVSSTFGQTPSNADPRTEAIAASESTISGRLNLKNLATSVGPKAIARVSGIASPGLKLTLDGSGSSGGTVWYRWTQFQGPKVAIKNADQAEASLVVPADAATLGFVLVVGNSAGIDARSLGSRSKARSGTNPKPRSRPTPGRIR